jgi:aromatic ring-opening dioxygenase catalytic subunit (LigB family)
MTDETRQSPTNAVSHADLRADADKLADDLLGRIAIVFGRHTVDARMVVTACSMVAGSYEFAGVPEQLNTLQRPEGETR